MFPLKDNIPLSRLPLVTIALIALDVVVYVLSLRHGGSFFGGPSKGVVVHYGAIPAELTHSGRHCGIASVYNGYGDLEQPAKSLVVCPPSPALLGPPEPQPATWQTVFSSLALHKSFVSLLADVLALAIFAPNVEDATGRLRFLCLCILGAVLALALQVLLAPNSPLPALGACGVVAVVLGAYVRLYPRARVISLAPVPFVATILAVPAPLLILVWLLLQLWFGLAGLSGPDHNWIGLAFHGGLVHGNWLVAYAGDITGLIAGALLIGPFASATRRAAKVHRTPHQPVY
jgi:membrane associated rhomboid family serine protease